MAFCGYKFSLCLLLISCWGLVQLLLMGMLFYCETPAFLEDLPLTGPYENIGQYMNDVHHGFGTNALNCLIAACLYIITLGVSGWQFYLNQKTTYQV
ncbi:ribonuclease kappa-like [Penaeus indicus]|uniref:ribonuclease kappa-like n=1 Tax=Penaeus japonicus TaxID=27405 RepID=UPI001C714DC6|nr:ribonuclease kappa-like [Penaeus japonicus]XP_042864357.1 ribonuclease kappa-like [Penaeus japonicus]XP_047474750.1 ribonuclease kappa-like [Penaeus chinensis]XP_047474751.1 ribonuclease kappa-like [Penaeus chinensis]